MGIRSARAEDLSGIHGLLQSLQLPVEGVDDHLGHFLVLDLEGGIQGTVGLEVYGRRALLRSLGVAKERQGRGWGERLLREILAKARAIGVSEIVLLTESATMFFQRRGFKAIPKEYVAEEVRRSVEFRMACADSAVCMRLDLA